MLKLEPQNQIQITENNISEILKTYEIFKFTFVLINKGIENTSVLITAGEVKYVLRIYKQSKKKEDDVLFEINFQDYLRDHGVPIPIIFKNIEKKEVSVVAVGGKTWNCIMMAFVEGQSSAVIATDELIRSLAKLQAKMHLLGVGYADFLKRPRKLWKDLHDSLAENIKDIPGNEKTVYEFLERAKSFRYNLNPNLPYGYNHMDIDLDGNLIVNNNKIMAIIDFDDLRYSPIIACLGFTLWNVLDDQGMDAMYAYLKEYEKIRLISPLEYEALPSVLLFRNYIIGIIRIATRDSSTSMPNLENIFKLEQEIPNLFAKNY